MDFDSKYAQAMVELNNSSIVEGNYAPPFHKLLRRWGVAVRPPHYAGFGTNWLMTGLFFGLLWGGFMWLVVWQLQELSGEVAAWASIAAGGLFGFVMAIYYKFSADKHKLSRWEDL